jgi:hypothetical protein
MNIPEGMTEAEVLEIIDKISNRLSWKFVFPGFDREDIEQEAKIIALDGLKRYDPDKPLENFLWVHVRKRLCNFKRDNFTRPAPCSSCPLKAYLKKTDSCALFKKKDDCELYANWKARTEAKKNIINPLSINGVADEGGEYDVVGSIDNKELLAYIDEQIPIWIRHTWLQARAGEKIGAEDMRQLKEIVLEIFNNREGDDEV